MSSVFLDSFQLIVAVYLLFIAIRGDGQMFHFNNLTKEQQAQVRTRLRILYAAGGLFAAIDFALSALRTSMFTEATAADGTVSLVQKFTIDGIPFLNDYTFLSRASTVFTVLLVITLFGIVIWLVRLGKKNQ